MKRMMTELIVAIVLLLGTELGPAAAGTAAPNSLVIVACRVDDVTGKPGRHDPAMAARGWKDLELHLNDQLEYECKRIIINNIVDATPYQEGAPTDVIELTPNFGNPSTCARVGVPLSTEWDQDHPGWATVAVGCPSPTFADDDGDGHPDLDARGNPTIVGWRMPGCPTFFPGRLTGCAASLTRVSSNSTL